MTHDLALEICVDAAITACFVQGGMLLLFVLNGLLELWWRRKDLEHGPAAGGSILSPPPFADGATPPAPLIFTKGATMSESERTRRLEEAQRLIADVLEGGAGARNKLLIARRQLDAVLVAGSAFDEVDAEGEASRAG